MNEKTIDRRNFLKLGTFGLGSVALASPLSEALAATCGLTPAQAAGPFYPGESRFTETSDLTQLPGRDKALGQVVYIRGTVLDLTNCTPIRGANVEIWQACESGAYNHRSDPNPAKRDPNFRYWGEAFTEADGVYLFKTIIPGAYPADATWDRPPHVHFRVMVRGYDEMLTQMYFKGEKLNDADLILQRMAKDDQDRVVVDFKTAPEGFEPGSLLGDFDIVLKPIR